MDYISVLVWWLVILLFGLIGWPLAASLFPFLPDRGYTLARPVGLLLTGYILWLGASFRLLQNNPGGIIVALTVVAVTGLIWQRRQARPDDAPSLPAWLGQRWRYVLLVEALFAVTYLAWVYYKAHNPNIETAGGEKWMEIAFINGILRSQHFPPQDPWLSGFGISYYYFGYVLMAMVTQLTGIVSTEAFNLYIPTLLALTLTGAFGLMANLVNLYQNRLTAAIENLPAVATGLLAALFVGLLGNLIGVLEVLHKRGLLPPAFWIWLDIRDLKIPPAGPSASWIPDRFIWWWRGSRVLTDYNLAGHEQEVIDEFPFFSFLLGDVHPHVLALPFVLLVIALALHLLLRPVTPPEQPAAGGGIVDKIREILENSWRELLQASGGGFGFGLIAVAVGGLSFLNTWDFPIYLGVIGLALVVRYARSRPTWSDALLPALLGAAAIGLAGVLLYLPFYATFQSQARGILPNLWNPTRLPQFFVFFGPFLVAVTALLLALSARRGGWQKRLGWTLQLTVLGPLLLMLTALTGLLLSSAGRGYVEGLLSDPMVQQVIGSDTIGALLQASLARRLANPWTFLLLGGLLGWVLALAIGLAESAGQQHADGSRSRLVEQFVLILLVVGLALPLAVEFIYLRDNFGIRMNTIFKFYFQAWVLLALASAFAVYYVSVRARGAPRLLFQVVMALLVAGGLIYPVLATLNKANNFQDPATLNGIAWIAQNRPDDYAAIEWLRQNAPDNAIILEAPGSSYAAYQYTGRISALTGLPTLLGWGGHESQWRGNYDEPARREPEIDLLFNTLDPRQAQALLDKYHIKYVYVGALERERYSPQSLKKFANLMTVAFQQGDVIIYQR